MKMVTAVGHSDDEGYVELMFTVFHYLHQHIAFQFLCIFSLAIS